ncbi:calcium-binding protein [Inquilinus sp. NPDC058860]|uniref:calcium-binding protein n=1 Tax=Inquilinus sp. NPDC058860 TaxID=3346652 RepID=UPI0036A603CD
MATRIFAGNTVSSGIPGNLAVDESVFVAAGAVVGSTDSTAIHGTGSHRAIVQGTVFGDVSGIQLAQGVVDVAVGAYVGGYYGVAMGDRGVLDNHGTIWGELIAVEIGGSPFNPDPTLGGWTIENTGLIESAGLAGVRRHDGSIETIKIRNSGVISGDYAYQGDTGDGIDVIVNTGRMEGSVILGSGDDLYDGHAGRLDGGVSGGDGNDRILCAAGDNDIDGGAGIDFMQGGAGNDRYTVDTARDTVDESVAGSGGIDTVIAYFSFSLIASAYLRGAIENLQLGPGNINGTGNALANQLVGFTGNNVLDGGAGADTMIGYVGNDTYVVDNAGDVVDESFTGSNGIDTVRSTISFSLANTTAVRGAVENLTLLGSANLNGTGNALANQLVGNAGANTLSGLAGNDTLQGGGGADRLDGGAGNDILRGEAGADTLIGGTGIDTASYYTASAGVAVNLASGTGSGGDAQGDTLSDIENLAGSRFNDSLIGNTNANALHGGDGNDALVGAGGADAMTGGAGADRFVYGSAAQSLTGAGADRIADFSHAQGDRVDLSAIDANTAAAGNQAFGFIGTATYTGVAGQLRYAVSGGVTTIAGDLDGDRTSDFAITLTGAISLVAGDFVL